MSVRAIAIRNRPQMRPAAVVVRPPRTHRGSLLWAAFTDDRRLVGLKVVLLGLLILAAMALEVPF